MCKEEVPALSWEQVDLDAGTITLAPEDAKTDEPRLIVLTARAKEAVAALHAPKANGYVFRNPRTKTRWVDVKKRFLRAVKAAELHGLWFHDLRRSFITRARRVGVPESVVMRMSGHRTRAVFERYNVVDTQDLRAAVRALESLWARAQKHQSPTVVSAGEASEFRDCGGPIGTVQHTGPLFVADIYRTRGTSDLKGFVRVLPPQLAG